MSWMVDIFPYVQSTGLRLDKAKPWDDPANLEVRGVDMLGPVLLGELPMFRCGANPSRAGAGWPCFTHYVAIAGLGADAPKLAKTERRAGAFGYERYVCLNDVKDGQATTLLLAETAFENGPWTAGGHPTLRSLLPERSPYLGPEGQFSALHRSGMLFSRRSGHATNMTFADGSVRSLRPDVSPDVLEALATLAGGERVGLVGDE